MVTSTGKQVAKTVGSGRRPSRGAPTVLNVPAGGTGAAAGGWDTAVNRDLAITAINLALTQLRAMGIIA